MSIIHGDLTYFPKSNTSVSFFTCLYLQMLKTANGGNGNSSGTDVRYFFLGHKYRVRERLWPRAERTQYYADT